MADAIDAENPFPAFDTLANSLERHDYNPALVAVRAIAVDGIRQAFATATSPDGKAWPLAASTVNDDARNMRRSKPLLIDTGAMIGAATGRNAGTAADTDQNAVEVGVQDGEVFYAKYHQHGTSKLPSRPFIGMNDSNIDKGSEVVADHAIREVFN